MQRTVLLSLTLTAAVALASCASTGGDSETGERFRGNLVSMGGPTGGGTAYVDLHAQRYATDEEVEALARTLVEGGEKALFDAVRSTEPMGWVRVGNNTSYHLRLLRSIETEDGRILRGVTDRPIQFMELARSTRSRQYEFGIVEFQLDAKAEGSGAIIPTAKISFENDTMVIESFGNQPLRILKVKRLSSR